LGVLYQRQGSLLIVGELRSDLLFWNGIVPISSIAAAGSTDRTTAFRMGEGGAM
jgi:hypothetical protein